MYMDGGIPRVAVIIQGNVKREERRGWEAESKHLRSEFGLGEKPANECHHLFICSLIQHISICVSVCQALFHTSMSHPGSRRCSLLEHQESQIIINTHIRRGEGGRERLDGHMRVVSRLWEEQRPLVWFEWYDLASYAKRRMFQSEQTTSEKALRQRKWQKTLPKMELKGTSDDACGWLVFCMEQGDLTMFADRWKGEVEKERWTI